MTHDQLKAFSIPDLFGHLQKALMDGRTIEDKEFRNRRLSRALDYFYALREKVEALDTHLSAEKPQHDRTAWMFEPGGQFKHVKTGGLYRTIARALREEDGLPLVIYRSEETGENWARPAEAFFDGRFVRTAASSATAPDDRKALAEADLRELFEGAHKHIGEGERMLRRVFNDSPSEAPSTFALTSWMQYAMTYMLIAYQRSGPDAPPAISNERWFKAWRDHFGEKALQSDASLPQPASAVPSSTQEEPAGECVHCGGSCARFFCDTYSDRCSSDVTRPELNPAPPAAEALQAAAQPVMNLPAGTRLPRHQFWGAGEPDCPADLKAPNGELHTARCKFCGDGWRKSKDVCLFALQPSPVAEALDWVDDFIARCNGDDRGACAAVNVLRAALSTTTPQETGR